MSPPHWPPAHRLVLGALALMAVGAPSDSLVAQFPRSWDSAGVRIVANAARATAPVAFMIDAKPMFELGGLKDNPNEEFDGGFYQTTQVVLTDGTRVVTDWQKVRFFNPAGKQIRVVGRKGQGPEDYFSISSMCRTRGDTLVVNDPGNGRTSVLDGKGNYVRAIPTGTQKMPRNGCFDDGTFVVMEQISDPTGGLEIRLNRTRVDGTKAGVIGPFPAGGSRNRYLHAYTQFAAVGDRLFVGDPRASEVKGFDPQGRLVIIVRTNDPIAKITSAEAAILSPAMGAGAGTSGGRGRSGNATPPQPGFPLPTEWPSFDDITVDPAGRLLIQDYMKGQNDPYEYTVFDHDGRMLGKVKWRGRTSTYDAWIAGFTGTGVVMRRQDDDGAIRITTYGLRPAGGRGN